MGLFDKYMSLLNIPECIPNLIEGNFFDKLCSFFAKILQKLFD